MTASKQKAEISKTPMSVEEARSVLWLRNNHRPLGELLDEGYLNEHRLAWAAEKAYDLNLRKAASVLLQWLRHNPVSLHDTSDSSTTAGPLPAIQAGIPLQQARATRWPFKPFKDQPMGTLVDTQQVGLKDLVYAIENAWDERVRQAAIVLMALRLNQVVKEPPAPAGPLRVVAAGRSYSERKQFFWTSVQGMFIGALGVLWILGFVYVIQSALSRPSGPNASALTSPAGIIALAILVAVTLGAGWLTNRALDLAFAKMDQQIDNYRKGQEGEDRLVEAMRHSLDGTWTLFRNITLPGRNQGDIDLVLVGPTGVWASGSQDLHRRVPQHRRAVGVSRRQSLEAGQAKPKPPGPGQRRPVVRFSQGRRHQAVGDTGCGLGESRKPSVGGESHGCHLDAGPPPRRTGQHLAGSVNRRVCAGADRREIDHPAPKSKRWELTAEHRECRAQWSG